MRIFQAAARMERRRRRMVVAGQLIDITEEAHRQGLPFAVYVSRRLWTGLIRPYPFAQQDDCVAVPTLVSQLKLRLRAATSESPSLMLILPSLLPVWFQGPCYLRLLVNRPSDCLASVLIQPQHDRHHPRIEEDSLPASLVVNLAATLHSLSLVARNVEREAVDAMQKAALELARPNPFYVEIVKYLDSLSSRTSTRLSPECNWALLVPKLDELLGIVAACGNRSTVPTLESLRRNYRMLVSPLAGVAELTESLLRLAAHVPQQSGPVRYEPFRPLLNLYVELNRRLTRFETEIPHELLSAAEFQVSLLAKVLPVEFQVAVDRVEQELGRIVSSQSSKCSDTFCNRRDHAVVWH